MASWAALRTFGNELRLADPYGPLVGDEIITVHSPAGAPRRSREGSFPIASLVNPPGTEGRQFPIFGDNGELNAFHPGLAPDAFYMFGGETEGDGNDGLFVKQDAEPETFGAEDLHNTDIEVPTLVGGNAIAQKQLHAGIVCGTGWSVDVPNPPALAALDDPDLGSDESDGFPEPVEPPIIEIVPPIPPDGPLADTSPSVSSPLSKATAVAGVQSDLQLFCRAEGYKLDRTWVPRQLDVHTPPNNFYSVRIRVTRTSTSGSLTPSFQGGGATDVGTPISASGFIEQRIAVTQPHTRLVLTKSADFVGEVLWASVRWVRKRTTGAKKTLTGADGSITWYKRTPEEITLERCGIGNVRSDDEANMDKVQAALNDAQEWARDTAIPIKLGPKTYCVNGRPHGGASESGAFHLNVGDNITIEGCGKQSVLKNCMTDSFAVISVQGGTNITLRNFTVDGNCYEHPWVFLKPDHTIGGNGIIFFARSTVTQRLVIENLWVRRTDSYGVGTQSADIKSAIIDGLFLEDCGTDGLDIKQYNLANGGDSAKADLARQHTILNNIHVTGFGRNKADNAWKTGLDLRGYIVASNLYIHDLRRSTDYNVSGIRFNADVGSSSGRVGGRTSQISNARVICTDPPENQSAILLDDGRISGRGRCIGMQICSEDVNVSNYLCEGAHTGLLVETLGSEGHAIYNVALSNIRINAARGADGKGAGIYWTASQGGTSVVEDPPPPRSGYSQLGPFHITDCDRGIEVHGVFLRGSGIIQNCTRTEEEPLTKGVALYLESQEVSDKTQLDILYRGNTTNVYAPIAGVSHYLSRTLTLTTTNVDTAADEIENYLHRLNALGGGELIINGTHLLNKQVRVIFDTDNQIVINGQHGVPTLKAVKGPNLPVSGHSLVQLISQTQNHGTLFINNLEFDCSEGGNNTTGGNTAGLSLHLWKTAHLYDVGGKGGDGTTGSLNYDGGVAPFAIGQTVTGQDSSAVGTVRSKTGTTAAGVLALTDINGTFVDNELIIGPVGGGIANANHRLFGNLTGDQCVSTVSIYDFLWQGGWARDWSDMAFYPSGDATRDGLHIDNRTAPFTVGDLIVGTVSNASGLLVYQTVSGTTGTLYMNSIRGQFIDGEVIHGHDPISMVVAGTATVDGTMIGQPGDGFMHVIRGVLIERCTNGVSFKREGYSLLVDGCAFRSCGGGVTTAEVTGPFIGSGRLLEVSNCRFFRTTNVGAPLRCKGDTRVHFHDNYIRDWGRYANGDAAQTNVWAAVHIQGPRDFVVSNNIFEMIDWLPGGSHTGIYVQQFNGALEAVGNGLLKYDAQTANFPDAGVVIGGTSAAMGTMTGQLDYDATSGEIYLINVSGVFQDNEPLIGLNGGGATVDGTLTGFTHTPFGGVTRGNVYRNLDYGIREYQTGANSYLDEYFDNVTNPTIDAAFNVGSRIRYTTQRAAYATMDAGSYLSEQVGPMHRIVTPGVYIYSGTTDFTLTSGNRVETVRLTGNIGSTNHILTLTYLQAGNGATFRISRTGPGAGTWDITAITATTSNSLKLLAVNTWCDVEHDGTDWRLTGYGAL